MATARRRSRTRWPSCKRLASTVSGALRATRPSPLTLEGAGLRVAVALARTHAALVHGHRVHSPVDPASMRCRVVGEAAGGAGVRVVPVLRHLRQWAAMVAAQVQRGMPLRAAVCSGVVQVCVGACARVCAACVRVWRWR